MEGVKKQNQWKSNIVFVVSAPDTTIILRKWNIDESAVTGWTKTCMVRLIKGEHIGRLDLRCQLLRLLPLRFWTPRP